MSDYNNPFYRGNATRCSWDCYAPEDDPASRSEPEEETEAVKKGENND